MTTLREVEVPILTEAQCSQAPLSPNTAIMLCAGEVNDGVDTCQGDSDGPLVVEDTLNMATGEKQSLLIGITSWGIGCGDIGVYTKVQNYFDWIENTIKVN